MYLTERSLKSPSVIVSTLNGQIIKTNNMKAIDKLTNRRVTIIHETRHERFIRFEDGTIDERLIKEVIPLSEVFRRYLYQAELLFN